MKSLDDEIDSIIDTLNGQGVVDATEAAARVILDEVSLRAVGTIRDALALATHVTDDGAKSSVYVAGSAPGGDEHHAVFQEFGTSKMAARPFMRPAFDLIHQQAAEVFESTLAAALEK